MNILIVGGTWNNEGGKPSGLINKIFDEVAKTNTVIKYNGGYYDKLVEIYNNLATIKYDSIWWFANVPNDLPKIRDVKEIQPYTMLVTSKRNNNEYSDMDIIQRALVQKANLLFEFSKTDDKFNIRVIDPLGCIWANTTNITIAIEKTLKRLEYLRNVTRQRTSQSTFNDTINIPDQTEFISLIRKYANVMQTKILPLENEVRFLGNASLKTHTRCSKTMPSFMQDNMIFVSKRNVPKQFIEQDDFVPVYMENEELFYCGENKPSVDTPVQIRLYKALPNIRYMIHFHAYLENVPTTSLAIPCGAINEVNEVLNLIDTEYKSRELNCYAINLKGHGAIIMSDDIEKLKNYKLIKRPMPENCEC